MKAFIFVVLPVFLLASGCKLATPSAGSYNGNTFYKRISIAPANLVVRFHDPIPAIPEPRDDFYWPFYRGDDHCSLDHCNTIVRIERRVRYNAFDLDPQHRITCRTKYQVVLSGAFGTFYAETRYSYAPFYQSTNTSFRIYAYGNSLDSEPPEVSDSSIPHDSRLSIISVIRVFQTPTGHSLISACYAPDGLFLSLGKNCSVDGDCREGGGTVGGLDYAHPEKFGLPARFPVSIYSPERRDFLSPSDSHSTLDCVSFHYARNRVVKQHIFPSDQPAQIRTLTYKVTPEDIALDPIDDTRSFGRH